MKKKGNEEAIDVGYVNCLHSLLVKSFPTWFMGYVHWILDVRSVGELYGFLILCWFLSNHLATWLHIAWIYKVHSFPLTLLTHTIAHLKSSWLLCAHCILSGGEFESLVKHMVDCTFGMTLEWIYAIFKCMSGSVPHFPKVWFDLSIWLYSIPCACVMCFLVLWGWSSLMSSLQLCISLRASTFSWFWNVLRIIWVVID